jgi:acetylornithine/N-succinyldiaminopimelate aminotransferase
VIQAESGVQKPSKEWLQALRKKCTNNCCLLICDEIQSGFGRSGTLWAFEQFDIIPDVLLLGKALGGGMPMGAFVASHALMQTLTNNPVLGHINTFGGHPVCAAAGMAAFQFLLDSNLIADVQRKERLILNQLQHKAIKAIHHAGLWMAVQFDNAEIAQSIVHRCVQNGAVTDWFLFAPDCLRIAPPLIATDAELNEMVGIVLRSINDEYSRWSIGKP